MDYLSKALTINILQFFCGFKHFTDMNVLGRVLGVFEIFYGVNILFGGVEMYSKCIYGNL